MRSICRDERARLRDILSMRVARSARAVCLRPQRCALSRLRPLFCIFRHDFTPPLLRYFAWFYVIFIIAIDADVRLIRHAYILPLLFRHTIRFFDIACRHADSRHHVCHTLRHDTRMLLITVTD